MQPVTARSNISAYKTKKKRRTHYNFSLDRILERNPLGLQFSTIKSAYNIFCLTGIYRNMNGALLQGSPIYS